MTQIEEPKDNDDAGSVAAIGDAMRRASEAEARGDLIEALHILRSTPTGNPFPTVEKDNNGSPRMVLPVAPLILKARMNLLALQMGQWGDSPRHDPNSDTPHGWVTMYESINPSLPESNPTLRYWMNRLRVSIASDHHNYSKMAAWSYDQYVSCDEDDELSRLEAVGNMAVAVSHLGYKATAGILYDRVLAADGLTPDNRAAFAVRFGDYLWSAGDRTGAFDRYTQAIDLYRSLDHPRLNDLHNMIRVYARRCDFYLKTSDDTLAFADLQAAFNLLDSSRELGAYESARSVDANIRDDIAHLVDYLTQIDVNEADVLGVAMVLSRLGNTSTASRLRRNDVRKTARDSVYYGGSRKSAAAESRVRASMRWHPFTDEELSNQLASDVPLLMATMSVTSKDRVAGVTLLAGGGQRPTAHTWQLRGDHEASEFDLLLSLVKPPPGVAATETGVWTAPWRPEVMRGLARRIVPMDDLVARLDATNNAALRVVPVGTMWRFPFASLPVRDLPMGSVVPIVLAPGPTVNLPRPTTRRWAGHFDLTLPNAVSELRETLTTARALGVPFELISSADDLTSSEASDPVSLLVFSAHGLIGRDDQRLIFAGGHRSEAIEFRGLATGATVVLNACWSGYVFDHYGSDPSHQALEFLAAGAHSVLGTIGPINDRSAGAFLRECLPPLAQGMSMAHAYQSAVRQLLSSDASRPMASWASYVTIGRHPSFAPGTEETDDC